MEKSGEFPEQILKELIDEGYNGYELLDEFRVRQAKIGGSILSFVVVKELISQFSDSDYNRGLQCHR